MVSIIIPTYNRANYVVQAINTVLSQTYGNLELIIINDGSTDNTENTIAKINDSRIKYYYQENRGRCAAMNAGLARASGRFIAILGDDDLWFPYTLKAQLEAFEKYPDAGVVFGASPRINANNEFSYRLDFVSFDKEDWTGNMYKQLLVRCGLSASTVLVKSELYEKVGTYDESLYSGEDWDMWIRLSKVCNFCRLAKPLAAYRIHSSNSTQNLKKTLPCDLQIVDKHLGNNPEGEFATLKKKAQSVSYTRHAYHAILNSASQGFQWLKYAQENAAEIGEFDFVMRNALRYAIYNAEFNPESILKNYNALETALNYISSDKSHISKFLKKYWATFIYGSHLLRDSHMTLKCTEMLIRRCGIGGLNRGIVSMASRALFSLWGTNKEKSLFECEKELLSVLNKNIATTEALA